MAGIKIIKDISAIGGADVLGTAMSAVFGFILHLKLILVHTVKFFGF